MTKYEKWYAAIIKNAKNRTLTSYKERHHILPRSLGGSEDPTNLVELTAREHFICHWLLVHIYTGPAHHKMIYALNGMKRNGKDNDRYETPITSRVYAKIKEKFSAVHSATMKGRIPWNKGIPATEAQKEKNRIAALGKKVSPEVVARRAEKQRGLKRSKETKLKISNALKGIKRGPMKEEHKKKRSMSLLGKPKNPDSIAKRAETLRQLAAKGEHHSIQKKICPHCGTIMNGILYGRWHGDKCKLKPPNNQ